jgi:predicted anti-sigma-YlaC factor YlaD
MINKFRDQDSLNYENQPPQAYEVLLGLILVAALVSFSVYAGLLTGVFTTLNTLVQAHL